jgi:hypothetical protein
MAQRGCEQSSGTISDANSENSGKSVSSESAKEGNYIYGTVIGESGTVTGTPKFKELTYNIQVRTEDEKVYTFAVFSNGWYERREALHLAIKNSPKVRIKKGDFFNDLIGGVGRLYSENIEVLQKIQDANSL